MIGRPLHRDLSLISIDVYGARCFAPYLIAVSPAVARMNLKLTSDTVRFGSCVAHFHVTLCIDLTTAVRPLVGISVVLTLQF